MHHPQARGRGEGQEGRDLALLLQVPVLPAVAEQRQQVAVVRPSLVLR